jgi:hypothetical protein
MLTPLAAVMHKVRMIRVMASFRWLLVALALSSFRAAQKCSACEEPVGPGLSPGPQYGRIKKALRPRFRLSGNTTSVSFCFAAGFGKAGAFAYHAMHQ